MSNFSSLEWPHRLQHGTLRPQAKRPTKTVPVNPGLSHFTLEICIPNNKNTQGGVTLTILWTSLPRIT